VSIFSTAYSIVWLQTRWMSGGLVYICINRSKSSRNTQKHSKLFATTVGIYSAKASTVKSTNNKQLCLLELALRTSVGKTAQTFSAVRLRQRTWTSGELQEFNTTNPLQLLPLNNATLKEFY